MRLFFRVYLILLIGLLSTHASAGVSQEAGKEAGGVVSLPVTPIMEIKRLETEKPLYCFELREVEIGDLFRVLAHDYNLNLLVDKDVQGKVTASLSNVTLEEALATIAETQNLVLEKKGNIIVVKQRMTSRVFKLKYLKASEVVGETSTTQTQTTKTQAGSQ